MDRVLDWTEKMKYNAIRKQNNRKYKKERCAQTAFCTNKNLIHEYGSFSSIGVVLVTYD